MSENKIKLWAEIDSALSEEIIQESDIDYQEIFARIKPGAHKVSIQSDILNPLTELWIDSYQEMITQSNQILDFSDGYCDCLFDYDYERVVCFYALSVQTSAKRDTNRQAGFIPGFSKRYNGKDRGHFLSHRQGGGMDVNFFPQKKEINRGWSEAGKIYRKMERFCASHSGVFCFSRPLYGINNSSWDPERIEYGIVAATPTQWRIVQFEN